MRLTTRIAAFILAVLTVFSLSVTAFADGEDDEKLEKPVLENADYVYFYNFENDKVLAEQGEMNNRIYPASSVKILAAITAIEALDGDYSRQTTVTDEMLSHTSGNTVGFEEGEIVSAEQMLYCMLVNGANDAAVVLSYIVSGSIDGFVELMNEKAFEIGARSSHFTNPTGMHDSEMYTTLADTAAIAKYAYKNQYFMEISSTQKYVMEETNLNSYRNIYNRNCLMSKYYRADYYYENVIGMNAGSTAQAGYTIVAVARNSEGTLTYLCIIMGARSLPSTTAGGDDELTNYTGAIALLDWAFSAYAYRKVLSGGSVVCEIPITLSTTADYVTLVPETDIMAFLPSDIDTEREVKLSVTAEDKVSAPVKKGTILGSARVLYGDEELGRVPLVATSDIERSEFLFELERIKNFTRSTFFITAVITAVVLTVIYVFAKARLRQRRLTSRVPRQYKR